MVVGFARKSSKVKSLTKQLHYVHYMYLYNMDVCEYIWILYTCLERGISDNLFLHLGWGRVSFASSPRRSCTPPNHVTFQLDPQLDQQFI